MKAFDAVLTNPEALNRDQVIFELAKLAEADEKLLRRWVIIKNSSGISLVSICVRSCPAGESVSAGRSQRFF